MLPVFRRFSIGDYPDAPSFMSQIFGSLNTFCETTTQTLNQNLVVGVNVQGQKFTTSFTTDTNYLTGTFNTMTFTYTGGGQPDCCLIGNISRADGTIITDPVNITSWYLNINTSPAQVTIRYIAGLAASTKYNLVIFVI